MSEPRCTVREQPGVQANKRTAGPPRTTQTGVVPSAGQERQLGCAISPGANASGCAARAALVVAHACRAAWKDIASSTWQANRGMPHMPQGNRHFTEHKRNKDSHQTYTVRIIIHFEARKTCGQCGTEHFFAPLMTFANGG